MKFVELPCQPPLSHWKLSRGQDIRPRSSGRLKSAFWNVLNFMVQINGSKPKNIVIHVNVSFLLNLCPIYRIVCKTFEEYKVEPVKDVSNWLATAIPLEIVQGIKYSSPK